MIETLFQIKRKVEAHMNAPLLRERELFLVKKQSEGNGIRSLQMTADQLLFATLHLSLGNEGTIVQGISIYLYLKAIGIFQKSPAFSCWTSIFYEIIGVNRYINTSLKI